MTMKQMNASYLFNEDRILLRFNTTEQAEYRLWLTRRVTLFILAASTHLLAKKLEQTHSVEAAKAIDEFEKEAILEASKTANALTQGYESGVQFPIGFDPLLVMDMSCSLTQNGEKVSDENAVKMLDYDDALSVDFLLPGGVNLNLHLAGNMIRALCLLLDQLRQQASWGEATLSFKDGHSSDAGAAVQTTKNISIH